MEFTMDEYSRHSGREHMLEPDSEKASDLLVDLRHWCAEKGVDFDATVWASEIHFNCEEEEDGK